MAGDERADGEDAVDEEQFLIDKAVAAAHGGATLGQMDRDGLIELASVGDGSGLHPVEDGLNGPLVPPSMLPAWGADARETLREGEGEAPWWIIRDAVEPARIQEFMDGADPTPEEMLTFARLFFDDIQSDTDLADATWGYRTYRLTATDGREAWLPYYCRGYSFSMLDEELDGPFPTEAAMQAAIRVRGYESADEVTIEDARRMLAGASDFPGGSPLPTRLDPRLFDRSTPED